MRASTVASDRRKLRRRALIRAALALLSCALLACNLDNPGDEPPPATLYFPNAMVLSQHEAGEPARYLFVANSNFDLRYKSGTVQAYSLPKLQDALDECDDGEDCLIAPGAVLEDEVRVGSFTTALAFSRAPVGAEDPQDFLFVTTRTDDSLAFIRVDAEADGDDVLRCTDDAPDSRCNLLAERGTDVQDDKPFDWPADPAALVTGPLSDWADSADSTTRYALVAHRGGDASMFLEDTRAPADQSARFVLSNVLTGLPLPLTNIGFDPSTRLSYLTIGIRGLGRVGFAPAEGATAANERGTLYNAGTLELEALIASPDARDLTFIPALPNAGEALSNDSALIVADNPSALLLVDVNAARNDLNSARVKRTSVVGAGASRVTIGVLGGRPTAAVASFDARAVYIIDLETMLTRSVVPNLSGPFELVLDEARELLYVADFRSSVIRIVDLSGLAATQGEVSARVIATLGAPRVLQELR